MSNVNRIDTTDILSRSLDALATRQKVTANNVANADTPNFKASEVRFENVLRRALETGNDGNLAMARTSAGHMSLGGASIASLQPEVVELSNTTMRNDGNNVDIEQEMATLATTTLEFNTLAEVLSRKFSMQRMIATDGR